MTPGTELCGIDPKQVTYLSRRGDLPAGEVVGSRRMFTLKEARQWISALAGYAPRPQGARAAVISCVNYHGGSTKTTTAFNLAQGLTLRGRRVLLVDLDPQASATTLTGMLPAAEVLDEHTIAPLTYPPLDEAPKDLRYAVQPTYWDGLDLIPAAPHLFNAEILLPIHSRDIRIEWWTILARALEPLKADYDVVIFVEDGAPARSISPGRKVLASTVQIRSGQFDLCRMVAKGSSLRLEFKLEAHRERAQAIVEQAMEELAIKLSSLDESRPTDA